MTAATDAGEAYVVFGKARASASPSAPAAFGAVIDLTSARAAATKGFIIQGDAAGDQAGWSVSSAGDVNGDGFDDLIVGAPYGDDGGDDRPARPMWCSAGRLGPTSARWTAPTAR